MKLVLTEAAVADLRSISAYTFEKWGGVQERRYLRGLWAKFEGIRRDPERFRPRESLFTGCRIAAEGRHVILFRCTGEDIEIVRVLHGSMDFGRHIPPVEE